MSELWFPVGFIISFFSVCFFFYNRSEYQYFFSWHHCFTDLLYDIFFLLASYTVCFDLNNNHIGFKIFHSMFNKAYFNNFESCSIQFLFLFYSYSYEIKTLLRKLYPKIKFILSVSHFHYKNFINVIHHSESSLINFKIIFISLLTKL